MYSSALVRFVMLGCYRCIFCGCDNSVSITYIDCTQHWILTMICWCICVSEMFRISTEANSFNLLTMRAA
jgi:hypothetical protein